MTSKFDHILQLARSAAANRHDVLMAQWEQTLCQRPQRSDGQAWLAFLEAFNAVATRTDAPQDLYSLHDVTTFPLFEAPVYLHRLAFARFMVGAHHRDAALLRTALELASKAYQGVEDNAVRLWSLQLAARIHVELHALGQGSNAELLQMAQRLGSAAESSPDEVWKGELLVVLEKIKAIL